MAPEAVLSKLLNIFVGGCCWLSN